MTEAVSDCNHTQRGDGEATARNGVRATADLLFPFIYVLVQVLRSPAKEIPPLYYN